MNDEPGTGTDEGKALAPRELAWLLPGAQGGPAEVLPRVQWLCAQFPDLFSAMWVLQATHQGLPRELLAAATQQFRPDLQDLSRDDVAALYTALLNGGRQGFDAVLRSRRKGERKSAAGLGWVKE
ncbi:hypothetical protein [Inhella proteolytica]|uniref:Uncharacterized protein n=1 Tax=Inhella proteolytica TaxID=2795029 RepID=A0A931J5E9_9BURK|nr:hypothetical protein [Inhella proteolytica]MBH9579083.1 hypothetical protein [Inhella proteolytica]